MEDDVDISALTMEQYIALITDDIKPGIVNPKIVRELRRKLFASTNNEDTYEHVRTVLEIVDLFYFSSVTHDAIMNKAIKHSRYTESLEETIIKFYEDTIKKQTTDDEKMRKILENTESNIRALKTITKNLQEKAYQLTHKVLTNTREKVKVIMTMGKENIKDSVPHDLPPTPFLEHLKEQMGSPYRTHETVHMIGNPEEIHNEEALED
ncbi:hypothetical protein Tco_0670662 [Tanacetum coccineum]